MWSETDEVRSAGSLSREVARCNVLCFTARGICLVFRCLLCLISPAGCPTWSRLHLAPEVSLVTRVTSQHITHMRHWDTNVDQKLSHDKVLSVSGHPGVTRGRQVCSVKNVMDLIPFKRNSEKWAIRTHFLPDIFSGVWDWAPDPASEMSSYLTQWPLADASADSPELWLSDTRQRLIFDLRMWA